VTGDQRPLDVGADASHEVWQPNSVLNIVNLLLPHWRFIAFGGACAALITALVLLILPREYMATASFVEQSPRGSSSLAGVAAQFGFQLPPSAEGQPPQFYQDLIRTRTILFPVIADTISLSEGRRATLLQIEGGKDPSFRVRQATAFKKVLAKVTTTLAARTGVVTVAVRSDDPLLAVGVIRRILAELDHYNTVERQSEGKREREFAERRRGEATTQLRAAEDRLADFESSNRGTNSPYLSIRRDRLSRDVTALNQLTESLNEAYERARLLELRDTPVLTVVEPPGVPPLPEPRGLIVKSILAAVTAIVVLALWVLLRSHLATARARMAPDVVEFDRLVHRRSS
jgi:uncharacterized protein involved in exopolysaccharide biosynthesis